jgi:hypothetical protein
VRSAFLSMPGRRLGGLMLGVAILMAAAGLVTQSVAIATGRDFVYGLVPAFDPGGSRNLQAWFASAALAGCAGISLLAAACARPDSAIQARGWLAIATVCLVWSAQRLTSVAVLWGRLDYRFLRPELVTVVTGAVICAAVVGSASAPRRRELRGLLVATALIVVGEGVAGAVGARRLSSAWAMALALQLGRLLEAIAASVFVLTVFRHLQSEHAAVSAALADAPRHSEHRPPWSARGREIAASQVVRALAAAIVVMLGISLTVALAAHPDEEGWWLRFLFVDFEGNLPTWFSMLLLLMCSVPAAAIAAVEHRSGDPRWRMWAMLAVLFVLLSADEGASLHELLVTPLRGMVGNSPWLRYPLILPGSGVAMAGALVFGRFLQSWPAAIGRLFLAGSALFLFGALGVETVGGWFDPVVHGPSVTYLLLATVEEGCEMIGATMMLQALLGHLAHEPAATLRV